MSPGEQAIHGGAEVVDVGAFVDHLVFVRFGGHVLGRPLDAALGLALDPGQAKVDDLHVAGTAEHDVVGLQVGVVDAAAVHVNEAGRHLSKTCTSCGRGMRGTVSSVLPLTYSISR